MDSFNTTNTDEDEGNRRNRTYFQESNNEQGQQRPLQTLDEESTQPSTQIQPNPYQLVPPVELQETSHGEEELGSSNTDVATRHANGALQEGQIHDSYHQNRQGSDTMLVKSVTQSSTTQPVKIVMQSEREIGSLQLEGDKAAIQANAFIQVRIDDGAHESEHRNDMMFAESSSVSELLHILGNDVACTPSACEDNVSVEEIDSSESRLLVTGRHGGQFIPTPVHNDSSFSLQIPSPGIQTTFEDNVSVEEIDCSESRLLVTGRHGRQFRPTPVEEIDSSESRLLVTGRHGGQFRPTPVHNDSLFSVQIPSPGIQTTMFVLERRFPSVPRNDKSVSVHFLASQDFSESEVCVLVSRMEEQPGTKLVAFCVEHMGLQTITRYFHTGFIEDQVTIRFQLMNQLQRNFRIKETSMAEKIITVPQIISLSQRWTEQPGAKAEVYVESLGEVGQLCQDHLRIMLQYGDTALTLLLPINYKLCGQNHHCSSLKK